MIVCRLLNWAGTTLLIAGFLTSTTLAQSQLDPSETKAKTFVPGIRIDWTKRCVEIDATVVLRKGALELIACSPQTREHESILSVSVRPLSIFQAMGLIGFEPGSPPSYDDKNMKWIEPSGHALNIRVRFEKNGRNVTWPIERWLLSNDNDKVPDQLPWIFTGSGRIENGRLAADSEGTLICVVDFAAALIAVGDRHSADDQFLWLRANTEAIPPIGTRCTLLITERHTLPLHISVDSDGTLVLGTRVISVEEAVSTIKSLAPNNAKPVVILKPKNAKAASSIESLISLLTSAGLSKSSIQVNKTLEDR